MNKSELVESLRTAWARGERPAVEPGANLREADLRAADLREADLRAANLQGANLWDADLWKTDLWDTAGGILQVAGLHPYPAVLVPTVQGWRLRIGCWKGNAQDLRDLIAQDDGWPEATGDQITARRPLLNVLADMCDLHATHHQDELDAIMQRWGDEAGPGHA